MPRITREPLTLKAVNAAKVTGKLYRLRDATVPGLLLRVTAAGTKVWAITWGRSQERVIGTYPVMTLEGARDTARRELGEAAEHGAPVAVVEARKPAAEKPITLGEFISEHFAPWVKHQKSGQATLDALKACFGNLYARDLRSVVALDIERFKMKRINAGRKAATVNRDLDRIRKVYSCALEWGFITEHPLRTVKRRKVDNARIRYLGQHGKDEETRLREALQAREDDRRMHRESGNAWCTQRGGEGRPMWAVDGYTDHVMPMVLLALNTGMRRGELFSLEWHNVNLHGKLLTVTADNAKSGKTRHLPLNAEAMAVLNSWKKQGMGDGLVFPGAAGERMTNINKSWDGIVAAAKLPDFHFHDLRHTFASKLVMAGVDLNTVRELLGHADIKMTLRYAHLAPGKLAAAVALLGGGK